MAALLFPTASACAGDISWTNTGTGSWFIGTNWSSNTLPALSDTARIDNSGTAIVPLGAGTAVASLLVVGDSGTGSLLINDGLVADTNGVIGNAAGSNGSVTVTGGHWNHALSLSVGDSGTGSLLINGGLVSDGDALIGNLAGSSGSATVTNGTLSTTTLTVGNSGTGSLLINGGFITDFLSSIGSGTGSMGRATVTSGTWNNLFLTVGDSGTGTLNLTGGVISAGSGAGTVTLAGNAGSSGTLNIGMGGAATGTLNAATVDGGAGTAVVNFDHTGTVTFAPQLTGSLAVNHLGAGTTILTGSNSYSGGTLVNAGTLQTTNATALGSGPVRLEAGATLAPAAPLTINSLTWHGGTIALNPTVSLLTVTNALTMTAPGTFALSGPLAANTTYDLVTYTTAGSTLDGFSANPLGSFNPVFTVVDNGDGTSTITVNYVSASSGGILSNYTPIFTPTTANFTVSGQTQTSNNVNTVNSLIFDPGSTLSVFDRLNVTSGNFIVGSGSATINGSGTVITPGNFQKLGGGLLNLLTNLIVNGDAFVNDGKLSVNGSLTAQNIFVQLGAWLKGDGVIFGNVFNNGMVAPGNSPGTLTINGNFTQNSSGTLQIEAASTSDFDHLLVTGNASLAGTLQAASFNGFKFRNGQQFAFLQAGSISGRFDAITVPNPSVNRGRFVTNGGTGTLVIAPTSYTLVAQNQNQTNVARALDRFIPATSGDRMAVSTALDFQSTDQYPSAFNAIMPGFYESLSDMTIEQTVAQNQFLAQRLNAVRLGLGRGFSVSGLERTPLSNDKDGKSVLDGKNGKDILTPAPDNHWGVWVQGNGVFAKMVSVSQIPNSHYESGGVMTGLDYAWNDNLTTGLYAGYQGTYSKYSTGSSTDNEALFGTYAAFQVGGFYADAIVGGGYSGFNTHRAIKFSTIDRTANAQPNGGQFTSYLDAGYNWNAGAFTFGPILSGQYVYAGVAPFSESGADSLDLRLGQENANSLRTNLGAQVAYTWKLTDQISLVPFVQIAWQHEFLEQPHNIDASLDGGSGPSFDYETVSPARDSVLATVGTTFQFGPNWNANFFYTADFGRSDFVSHMISTGLEWRF